MAKVELAKVAVEVLWSEPLEACAYVFQRLKIGRISETCELPYLEKMYETRRKEPPRGVPEEGGRFIMTGATKTGPLGSTLHEAIITVYISRDDIMRLGMLPGKVLDMNLSLEVTNDAQIRPTVVNAKKVESPMLIKWFDENPSTSRLEGASIACSRAEKAFKAYRERVLFASANPFARMAICAPVTPLSAIPNIKDYILDVIFNGPAVTVKWADGTKTTVKAQNGETIDPEKGFAMAVVKKVFGNNREYYHTVLHWLKKSKK